MKVFGDTERTSCPICLSTDINPLWRVPLSPMKEIEINGAFTGMFPILDLESTIYWYSVCCTCESIFLSPYDSSTRRSYRTSEFHSSKFEDKERWAGYQRQYDAHIKPALAGLQAGSPLRLLDAGCGAGQYLFCALADTSFKFSALVGMELSKPAIDKINLEADTRGLTSIISGYQVDLDAGHELLDLELPAFDFIVLSEVFEHLEAPFTAMKEMAAALVRGGRIFYTAQCPEGKLPIRPAEPIYMSAKGQVLLLERVGLRALSVKLEAGRWKTVAEKTE